MEDDLITRARRHARTLRNGGNDDPVAIDSFDVDGDLVGWDIAVAGLAMPALLRMGLRKAIRKGVQKGLPVWVTNYEATWMARHEKTERLEADRAEKSQCNTELL